MRQLYRCLNSSQDADINESFAKYSQLQAVRTCLTSHRIIPLASYQYHVVLLCPKKQEECNALKEIHVRLNPVPSSKLREQLRDRVWSFRKYLSRFLPFVDPPLRDLLVQGYAYNTIIQLDKRSNTIIATLGVVVSISLLIPLQKLFFH